MNHSHHHEDNNALTAAQMLGFGTGSSLSGYHLIFGFSLSMIIGTVGEGLDYIETITHGTKYHLMLQRIYRQLMLIGLISFGISFSTLGGSPFPAGYMNGFNFGDYTLFITAIYFCIQGIWTMVASFGLAKAWDRASKITSDELQRDVESCDSVDRTWKLMYYPFSVTRNQVEFRIFRSIFSSSYSLSTKHTELDFGLFLKMTHENNIMNIIDFDSWKGVLILILIGLASIKVQFFHSSCDNPVCEAEEEIWVFTCCGVVILLLSIFLFYWGRKSEMLLIQKSGVENIDDYPVFLMVESQMQAQFEKNVLKTANVKSAINELMVEAESHKLEEEAKKRKQSETRLYRTAHLVASLAATKKAATRLNPITNSLGASQSNLRVESNHPSLMNQIQTSSEHFDVRPFTPPPPIQTPSIDYKSQSSGASNSIANSSFRYAIPDIESLSSSNLNSRGLIREKDHDEAEDAFGSISSPKPQVVSSKIFEKLSPSKFFTKPKISVIPDNDIESNNPAGEPDKKFNSNTMSLSPWKKARQLLRKLSSTEDVDPERKKIKSKIKTDYNHQKFSEVFLLHSPELFYRSLHGLLTCNSLYLALWTTNFAIIANRSDNKGTKSMLIILSILPALFALPFVSQAIKSSSILKAVTKINLETVSSVVDKTQMKHDLVESFRQNLINFLHDYYDGELIQRTAVNELYEIYNQNVDGLTFEEFQDLIQGCHLHLPVVKAKLIYDEMDINRDESVNMEEFERFLFPEETRLNDQKKQKFFDSQNQKRLSSLGKHASAKRIKTFLDPHLISKI